MGSLGSRPSVPTPSQHVVFAPSPSAPASTSSQQGTNASASSGRETDSSTTEPIAQSISTQRAQSLLGRDRGRFGTISTSFRGLLGLSHKGARQQKTLLGE